MSTNSRNGVIKGVIHTTPNSTVSKIPNAKRNGSTLEKNENDNNLSCATRKSKVHKE
jgi:hypothetical protein